MGFYWIVLMWMISKELPVSDTSWHSVENTSLSVSPACRNTLRGVRGKQSDIISKNIPDQKFGGGKKKRSYQQWFLQCVFHPCIWATAFKRDLVPAIFGFYRKTLPYYSVSWITTFKRHFFTTPSVTFPLFRIQNIKYQHVKDGGNMKTFTWIF